MQKRFQIWGYPRSEHVKFWVVVAVAIAVAAVAGCTTLSERPATVAFLAEYATNKVIYESDDPADKAARIVAVADRALDTASGESVQIAIVRDAVERAINWDGLSPPDQIAARRLLDILSQELQARLGDGILDPEQLQSVRGVIQTVRDTAANFPID